MFSFSAQCDFIFLPHQKCSYSSNNPCCVFSGKSALHWAAAVNNVEAAIMLLKNGANKDMQNNKVQKYSPFFPPLRAVYCLLCYLDPH